MTRTVAESLVDLMLEAGIRNVYGVGGDSANPVADAIRRTDGKPSFIHVRNEEAGAFATGADAQVSGRPTAVLRSSGPGSLQYAGPKVRVVRQPADLSASGIGWRPQARSTGRSTKLVVLGQQTLGGSRWNVG